MVDSTQETEIFTNAALVTGGVSHRRDITHEIRRRILTGQYGPGQRIPPERQLETEFGCSRLTVAKAMLPLVADGLIERYRGRGTFVAERFASSRRPSAHPAARHVPVRGNVVKYISPGQDRSTRSSRDDVLNGLHDVLDEVGYHVSIDFYGDLEQHQHCLAKAEDLQIGGLVIWPAPDEQTIRAVTRLAEHEVPLVLIDTYLPELDCDYVVTDNIGGAAMMVRHLAQLGHRRIAYLTPGERRTSLIDRLSGFLRGAVEQDLPVDGASVVRLDYEPGRHGEISAAHLAQSVDRLLSQPNRPTALFASHDSLAIQLLSLLKSRGLSVPQDITVVGYDGIEAGEFCSVPLTTIKQDYLETARVAARILLERFNGRAMGLRFQSLIQPQLEIRASSASPRATA